METDASDPAVPKIPDMNARASSARLSVRDLDDLIGVVPYLVGFQPHASLVVVVVESGQVQVTARVDLAAITGPPAVSGLVTRLFERFSEGQAWCLAFTEDLSLAWTVLELVADCVGEDRLGRLVQVGDQRWRADHAAGLSGRVRPGASAVQAAALGMPLVESRVRVAAQISPPDEDEIPALETEFAAATSELAALGPAARRRRALLLAATAVTQADRVRLAVLAEDLAVQRAIVAALDAENAPAAARQWVAVIGICPPARAAGALGLLGVASWVAGDGVLQTICLERLDALAPTSPLAAMLDWINVSVLPPSAWPKYRAGLVGALADHARLLSPSQSASIDG